MAVRPTHTVGSYAAAGRETKRKNDEGLTLLAMIPMAFKGEIADANTPGDVLNEDGATSLLLPKGFVPTHMVWLGSVTGTNPTIDIGLTGGNQDAIGAEVDADGNELTVSGQDLGTALAADTVVTYADGASVPTGGTAVLWIHGVMEQSVADGTLYMK